MNFGALKKAKNKIVTDVPPEAEAVTSNTGEYITEEVITTNVNEAFNDYLANDSPFVAQMTKKLNEQRQEAAKEEMQPPPYEPPYEQTYYNYNDIPFNDSDVPPEDEEQQYYAPPTEEDERRMWQQAEAYEREMAMQEEGRPFEEPSEAELAYIAEQEAARETADQYLDEALGRPDAVCSANPNICWDDAPPAPPSEAKKPEPKQDKPQKDNEIFITPDMITGRKTYSVSQDYIDSMLDKIFERLEIPAIEFEVKELIVETGGNIESDLIAVSNKGEMKRVPLGENEQIQLDETMDEVVREEAKERG
ncbi:MAG: hypothetical protein IJK26_00080 [Clostridia bacterium]|nr:hypothetical protein [Clostridia bacterium]